MKRKRLICVVGITLTTFGSAWVLSMYQNMQWYAKNISPFIMGLFITLAILILVCGIIILASYFDD